MAAATPREIAAQIGSGQAPGLAGAGRAMLHRLPWLRRVPPIDPPPPAAPPEAEARPTPAAADASRAAAHAALSDQLWDEGFLLPGGAAEVTRLAGLLPLSAETTLLLLGRDAGGGAATIARQRGAYLAAHQHDAATLARMAPHLKPLGRRAEATSWDPAAPAFRPAFHTHALALEPPNVSPAALLAAIAAALKPGGELVLLDIVTGPAAPKAAPILDRWLTLTGRTAPPSQEPAIDTALRAAGFTPHVVEDAGPRQAAAIVEGWLRVIETLRAGRPRGQAAAVLVEEAETWFLRHRLLGMGALRLLRWHATLQH